MSETLLEATPTVEVPAVTTEPAAEASEPVRELERGKRLSDSMLWTLQRNFYDKGVTAWSSGAVPHYITNNPSIAYAYARVVTGFLTDLSRAGAIDPSQPVHVVELGSGSGRFGFLFLKQLLELMRNRGLEIAVRYVMTDFTENNIGFWRKHERLQPFYEQGLLDAARLDAEHDSELELRVSGTVLSAETTRNPIVVIANYLFDTITHDAFRVQNGKLFESLPVLSSARALDDPDLMQHLKVEYVYEEAAEEPYPEHAEWNAILAEYRDTLGETAIVFPVAALRCIENLLGVSGGRMMVISADKGCNRFEEMIGRIDPTPVLHGNGFSLTVNFDAIGRFFEHRGGTAMHTSTREASLEVSAFIHVPEVKFPQTTAEFREAVDGFGPIDYFNLKQSLKIENTLSARFCLELVRLSRWDPQILYEVASVMLPQLKEVSHSLKRTFCIAADRTWDNFYHIGDGADLAFELGRLFNRVDKCHDALRFYTESTRLFGPHKMTWFNMAECHYALCQLDEAIETCEKSLEMDPQHDRARNFLLQVRAEMSDRKG